MAVSRDVKDEKEGFLKGKSAEEIYRAHHNLGPDFKPLNGVQHDGKGCECDHCEEYRVRAKAKA